MELFVMPRLRQGLVASPPVTPLADRLAPHIDAAFRTMLDPDRIQAVGAHGNGPVDAHAE